MKVILLQDVANLGKRFEVVDVPKGHALNKLIPARQAEPATPENLKRVTARQAKMAADQTAVTEGFAEVTEKIAGSTQTMTASANEQGHLYEGLKSESIASFLTEAGFAVTAAEVVLDEPIKEVGEHVITLKEGEATANFTLNVTAA